MGFVFWQDIVSPHQSAFLRALAQRVRSSVTLVVGQSMSRDRQSTGWSAPDVPGVDVVVGPSREHLFRLASGAFDDRVHVFSGIARAGLRADALRLCIRHRNRFGVMAESGKILGWYSWARLLLHRAQHSVVRDAVNFVLAIGSLGPPWYRWCGYGPEKIFPFGYSVERWGCGDPNDAECASATKDNRIMEMVFVGRLVELKRVDLLLGALARARTRNWNLTVIGDGPERQKLVQLAGHHRIGERVHMLGTLPGEQIQEIVAKKDLLILPSRCDGWGAVVNEALMQGTPVICSDRCGASVLLDASWRGEVFQSGSVSALSQVLERWIEAGKRTQRDRERTVRWSERITGEAMATYFLDIIEHIYAGQPRPTAPWLPGSGSGIASVGAFVP